MNRSFYSDSIEDFLRLDTDKIIGKLVSNNEFSLEQTQRDAWKEEISILKNSLSKLQGKIFFEYSIPRMGQRIDVVIIINCIFLF